MNDPSLSEAAYHTDEYLEPYQTSMMELLYECMNVDNVISYSVIAKLTFYHHLHLSIILCKKRILISSLNAIYFKLLRIS